MKIKDCKDCITIKVPNHPEYVTIIRLVISAIASKLNMTLDEIYELKMVVSEACNHVVEDTDNQYIEIAFGLQKKRLIFNINNYFAKEQPQKRNKEEQRISEILMKSFMDKVEYGKNLKMEKNL